MEEQTHNFENGRCTECGTGVLLLDLQRADNTVLYQQADEVFRSESEYGSTGTTDVALILLGMANVMATQGDMLQHLGKADSSGSYWEGSDLLVTLALWLEEHNDVRNLLSETFETSIRGKYNNETTETITPISPVQHSDGSDNGSGFYL